jgi:hypothetical protein
MAKIREIKAGTGIYEFYCAGGKMIFVTHSSRMGTSGIWAIAGMN